MPSLPDRPKALTDETQRIILDAMASGMHLTPACDLAGISQDAVRYWQRLCESGAEHAQIYADFFGNIKRAVALAESQALGAISRGEPGWQSRAWFLERRFPKRWAVRKDPESKQDVSGLSDEDLDAIAKGKSRRRT